MVKQDQLAKVVRLVDGDRQIGVLRARLIGCERAGESHVHHAQTFDAYRPSISTSRARVLYSVAWQ